MSRRTTKPTKWHIRLATTQISLGIHPVWSESSLCAQWVAKDPMFLYADSKDSDQSGQMPRGHIYKALRCYGVAKARFPWIMIFAGKKKHVKLNDTDY